MNLEQATNLAESLNNTLAESLADGYAVYKVYPYWAIDFVKLYNVTLIPNLYNLVYDEATDSQKLAFARVSLASQLGQPTYLEAFVNTYVSNAAKDPELNDYLNK
jgi:hypothetical protein